MINRLAVRHFGFQRTITNPNLSQITRPQCILLLTIPVIIINIIAIINIIIAIINSYQYYIRTIKKSGLPGF